MPSVPASPDRALIGGLRGRLHLLVIPLILASALVWRLPSAENEWQFTLCENDSLYQLHRIQACLEHFPLVPSVDAYSHYPYGFRLPWLALHPVFYAAIARAAGLQGQPTDALIAWLSWVPPLGGLAAVLLALVIARCLTSNRWCIYTIGMFCAFSADVCRPFFFGTIDHHLFAHLGTLLLVWGRLRQRRAVWVIGLLALLAMTPEAIIYVSVLLSCLFLSELAACAQGSPRGLRAPWFWFVSPSIVCLLVWLVQRRLETAPLPWRDLSWVYLTLFQPLWFAVTGVAMAGALAGVERLLRKRRTAESIVLATGLAVAAVAAACIVFLLCTGALRTIAERLLVSARIFVGEETPVFSRGFWLSPPWYRILAFSGIFVGAKLLAGLRCRTDATGWFQWLILAAALALGFKEFRHLYVLSSLQLVGLGLAIFGTAEALRRLPMFSGPLARVLPSAVLLLATVPFLVATDVIDRAAVRSAACARLPVTRELAEWLRDHTPDPAPAGGGPAAYGVMSPWSIGHHIRIIGQRPVVVDPLNFEIEHRGDEALELVWQAKSADELMDALRRYNARYLVLTNVAEEIVGTRRRTGTRKEEFVRITPGAAPIFLPAMSQFASFRLFMSSGMSGEFGALQPRYFTRESETYTAGAGDTGGGHSVVVPKGQIYEVKPGAILAGKVPGADVRVGFTLRRLREEPVLLSIPLAVEADGRFQFATALPAPVEEDSFRVEGGYAFTAGDRTTAVQVTQAMVDAHALITVAWPTEPRP